jgi:hypothetical protein
MPNVVVEVEPKAHFPPNGRPENGQLGKRYLISATLA